MDSASKCETCEPWVKNKGNLAIALLFATIGIAAAVGLGSGDWYSVEASAYNEVGVANSFNGSSVASEFGSIFNTAYFGLRFGSYCYGPQTSFPDGSNQAAQGLGVQLCIPYTYASKYIAFQTVANDPKSTPDMVSSALDASTAYRALMGSSGIIFFLLAATVLISGWNFFLHIVVAHGWDAPMRTRLPVRFILGLVVVMEALVLILWITIFPYNYFYGQENLLMYGVQYDYDVYHVFGVGFAIQIGAFLVGLVGLFKFHRFTEGFVPTNVPAK